ncbi:MAG: extracellular solute-binding protein family 5 [Blastococcus sp.]|jgi:peptide/nickel transport system substrate-binding protein|nr:extracellular solute-binding protein family 5 [Blastococcus sp.]
MRPLSPIPSVLASAAVAVLALSACSGGTVRGAGDSTASNGGAGSTFVYAANLDVVTDWDPATSYSNEIIAMENVYESLTKYDSATQKVEPRLATSWSSADDGKTWTFTLRSGVKFHSGRTMDATAAKEAIERTISLKGGPAYIWDSVATIDTPKPTSLVFHLKYAAPLDLISSSAYAAYIYDTKAAGSEDLTKWFGTGKDAGTGPYRIAQWAKGQETEVKLRASSDYWGGWKGKHYTDLEFRVTPQLTTAWQLLQRGDVNFVERLNPQLFAQAEKNKQGLQTSSTPSFQNLLALFNTAQGPMSDLRLRKAVQRVIDSKGLLSALKGADTAATGLVPEGLLGHATDLGLTHDVAAAKTLLQQAGYGPGKPLTLEMTYAQGDDDQQLFATLLTSALDEVGVKLHAQPLQWNAQWERGKSADPAKRQDIFVMYWYPDYADPYSWLINIFHSANPPSFNLTYLSDKSVDARIDALPQLTANDRPQAEKAYVDVQRELIEKQAVVAPLYVQRYQRAYSANVGGYTDNPAYPNVVFAHDLTPGG